MAESNGYTENNILLPKGDKVWSDLTPGNSLSWGEWTSWTVFSDTTTQSFTNALGKPLRYQSDIIDLGASTNVVPRISVGTVGSSRVVIEHSNNSDMSSSTFLTTYTSDNTDTGTPTTYAVLDYYEPGYTDNEYTDFTARYVRITVYVEKFNSTGTAREIPELNNLFIQFETPVLQKEELFDQDTSTFSGSIGFRQIPLQKITTLKGLSITNHDPAANVVQNTVIVSKANKTIKTIRFDGSSFTTADSTIDIFAEGTPYIEVFADGNIRPA